MDVFPPDLSSLGVDKMVNPDWGLATVPERNTEEVTLGDGYVSREDKGLNAIRRSWSPSWPMLDVAVADYVYDWLEVRFKMTPFRWTHPVTKRVYQVTCESIQINYDDFGNAALDAKFEQDFNPVA